MKFELLVVGKLKEPALQLLCNDYQQRIARHGSINVRELRDDAALIRALPRTGPLVTLEVKGRALTSNLFSEKVIQWAGQGPVSFVIGGAEGIPEDVRRAAQFELSLSSMTLPHRLARLVLLEQLYRALSIWRGEPYARED